MKKLISLLVIAALAIALTVPALALDLEPGDDFYVTDETGHLGRELIDDIIDLNAQLENLCDGAQILVVFVDYFGDVYADEFAVSLFNKWDISSNGMLLVASTEEFRGGITVGEDIESVFPDVVKNQYLDNYFWDDFDDRDYEDAVRGLLKELTNWYAAKYNAALTFGDRSYNYSDEGTVNVDKPLDDLSDGISNFITFVIIVAVVVAVLALADRRKYRSYYRSRNMVIPKYTMWALLHGPHKGWQDPSVRRRTYNNRSTGSWGSVRPSNRRSSSSFRSSGSSGRSSFGGSRSSGGFKGSFRGGGGRSGGGFGGRR